MISGSCCSLQPFHLGTAEFEGRRRLGLAFGAVLLRRLRQRELAQLGFDRRPQPLLAGGQIEALLDDRDLGVIEQRVRSGAAGRDGGLGSFRHGPWVAVAGAASAGRRSLRGSPSQRQQTARPAAPCLQESAPAARPRALRSRWSRASPETASRWLAPSLFPDATAWRAGTRPRPSRRPRHTVPARQCQSGTPICE